MDASDVENIGFQTPVLFIIFNRPSTTKLVFNQIKKVKPKKLFIAADGPRPGNLNDVVNCSKARKIVNEIDWNCQVYTLFRDENLGCGRAVSSAINWFFKNVEEGIILEDDCLPDESFFAFCSLMLDKYRFDKQVMMISGTNFLFNKIENSNGYFFSKTYFAWGWATWRRAWNLYNFEIDDWNRQRDTKLGRLRKIFRHRDVVDYWCENFDKIVNKKIDTWDYQWCYSCIFNDGLSLNPISNLISNIGLIGAHGSGKSIFLELPTKKIDTSKILFLKNIEANKNLEIITHKNIRIIKPFRYKLIIFFKKKIKRILSLIEII
ncbi:MAG: nucleotide-diphospho-sugar transferase [candidate division TM6 bacterium GW2011_GWF2_36_6]|jgi:hypothetical protein|nr:MAG: nucleotide-diphospho-sugar transferase [candidate division TM6 bacterium GW2011_GWF2_36_6]